MKRQMPEQRPDRRPGQPVQTSIIQQVLQAYDLASATAAEPQKGYRNTSYPLTLKGSQDGRPTQNLIFYKTEPGILERIARTNQVSEYAAKHGLPARRVLGKVVKLQTASQAKYTALYNYLPGETIAWEAYTKDHIKLLGMALSSLHHVLSGYNGGNLPLVTDEYMALVTRMRHYFSDASVKQAMQDKLHITLDPGIFKRQKALLRACNKLPDQQALHMDFVRGNILFRPAEAEDTLTLDGLAISGILDFEKTAYGHPLFDVGRTLAFLLVDCKYKETAKIRKYFLGSGYNKRGPATARTITLIDDNDHYDVLGELIGLFLIYDFYKFLAHNPYEFLHQNEHYVRTKDILISHKLLIE